MRQHVLAVTAAAFVLTGALSASAQQTSPMTHPTQEQTHQQESGDHSMSGPQGMMDHGMMGQGNMMGMMGQRGMHCSMNGPMGMMGHPLMMRIMFILMDSNADGTISLQEFQAAHERIF